MADQQATAEARAAAAEGDFSGYHDDGPAFGRDVLGVRIWSRQRDMFDALKSPKKRIAIRSGQKTGKTLGLAVLVLWWLCTRPRAKVVVSASTLGQLKKQLWAEIRKLYEIPKDPSRLALSKTTRTLKEILGGTNCSMSPEEGLMLPDGRQLIGIAANDKVSAAGYSGDQLLIVADEASELDREVFGAFEGNALSGGWLLLSGNPTSSEGPYFDAFHTKSQFWVTIHIDSRETPNFTGLEEPIPGLADKVEIQKRIDDWGEDNPLFQIRVAGNFAAANPYSVITLAMVSSATNRWRLAGENDNERLLALVKDNESASLELGVDVARFGDDDSVIQPRRGHLMPHPHVVHGMDTVAVYGETKKAIVDLRRGNERVRVKVDTIGVGGGVADMLRADPELRNFVEIVDVNVSEKADEEDQFPNLRSQLWFALADWFKSGGAMPTDDKTEDELRAPLYSFDLRARRKVESKDEIKKRLKRSPDRADAMALAVYEGHHVPIRKPPPITGYRMSGRGF